MVPWKTGSDGGNTEAEAPSGYRRRRRRYRLRRSAIGELHAGDVTRLLEAEARWPQWTDPGGQCFGKEVDEVGAMHSKGRVPAG